MTPETLYLIVMLLGLFGFWVAYHIGRQKKKGKPFVCPLNFDCHAVVTSNYSKLLGVPLEYMGMFYYAFIVASYGVFTFLPELVTLVYTQVVLVMSVAAFVFSFFLTFVQAVRLKEWCSWCLASALISTLIFGFVLASIFRV